MDTRLLNMQKLGFPDEFGKTVSPYQELLEKYGLTVENIVNVVKQGVKNN